LNVRPRQGAGDVARQPRRPLRHRGGDANTDPVIVSIGIRNVATFEMNIPQAYYDAFALLELIEKHTGDEHANA
jgi:hypothetical protein